MMADVLRLAQDKREELASELASLDEFVRMAEELLTGERKRRSVPEVDPFQARFNSGEVLPPLSGEDGEWTPAPEGTHFVRSRQSWD